MYKKKLVVYILSYRRPEYLLDSLESVITQDYESFDVIISENSPDNSIVDFLNSQQKYSQIKIVKRLPSMPTLDHFNLILEEVKQYEFAMLFHDDDVLMPRAISEMMRLLTSNYDLVAVGCNALIIKNSTNTNRLLSTHIKYDLVITSQSQLIKRYLFRRLSHPPFPSYIYRTAKLKDSNLATCDGGKYSDASFLVKLIRFGPIYWFAQPLMYYRQHDFNDSATINLNDLFKLSLFFLKTSPSLLLYIIGYFLKLSLKKLIQKLKIFVLIDLKSKNSTNNTKITY